MSHAGLTNGGERHEQEAWQVGKQLRGAAACTAGARLGYGDDGGGRRGCVYTVVVACIMVVSVDRGEVGKGDGRASF